MIVYNQFSQPSGETYEGKRLEMIIGAEALKTQIYIDLVGVPTIGAGMNLREEGPRNAVINKILSYYPMEGLSEMQEANYRNRITAIVSQTYVVAKEGKTNIQIRAELDIKTKEIQKAVNAIMAERSGNPENTFTFKNEQDIKDTFADIAQDYEDIVDSKLPGIPQSSERIALFSLAFNGGAGVLSSALCKAITDGDRAEAWYQIRYQLNGGTSKSFGIAVRRAQESELFGLYNDQSSISEEDAKSVFRMLGKSGRLKQRAAYDAKYRHDPVYKSVDGVKVKTGERDYITKANEAPHLKLIQDYDDSISPAFSLLSQMYAPGITIDQIIVDSTANQLSDKTTTATNSLMFGEDGFDTFDIPALSPTSGIDEIIDSNSDGKIRIGGEVLPTSKALPKTNPVTNEVIADQWTLGTYNLARVGNDLEISKSGTSAAASSGSKLIIKNYPFSASKPAFGINLDLQVVGLGSPKSLSSEPYVSKVDLSLYASSDANGRFFLPAIISDATTGNSNYAIRTYDANGAAVSTQLLTDIVSYEVTPSKITSRSLIRTLPTIPSCRLSDGSVAFIYAYNEYFLTPPNSFTQGNSFAFLAKVDAKGKLISNRLVHQMTSDNRDSFDRQGFHIPSFISPNGMCFGTARSGNICGTLDADQLSFVSSHAEFNYDGDHQDNSFTTLTTGHKITSTYQVSGADNLQVKIASPIYAQTPSDQRVTNYDISGQYVVASGLKKEMLSVSREEGTELQISENPNSYLAAVGFDSNPLAKMSLPVSGNSQIKVYSVKSSDYSLDDLLDGKFNTLAATPINVSSARRRRRLDTPFNSTAGNSTDDGFYYYGDDETVVDDDLATDDVTNDDVDLSDSDQLFTLLILPNNQTIILVGVNATELAKSPQNYYSLSELEVESASPSSQTTTSPVPNPTLKPTTQPISFMTNFLLPVPKGSAISSEFGDTQGDSLNNGITFAVAENTSINAIASGTVIRTITNHPEFGNVVVVRHDDGQTGSLYAHLNRVDVAVGGVVTDTTLVGLSGLTNAGNARLHLEVINGAAFLDVIEAASGTDIGSDYELSLTNPRPLFNTRYTDAEFTRTVLGTEGDSRDNKVKDVDGASNTILYGNAGNDKYFFDFTKDGGYLATHYTISDTDLDGAIEVAYGDGTYVTLEGNARAKTDIDGNVIANTWIFPQGFEAKLDGSNLVIFKAGADITDDSVGRITIENYSGPRSFGFTLGKTTDLAADGTSTTGYDAKTVTLTENRRFLGGTSLKTDDGFYAPVLQDTTGGSSGYRYRLGKFNSAGVLIDQFELSDEHEATNMRAPIKYIDPITDLESLAIPFSSQYTDASSVIQTRVGICLVGESGKRTSATIASASGSSRVNTANFLQQAGNEDDDSINPGDTYSNFIDFTYKTQTGQRLLQKIDMSTLAKLGSTVAITGNFQATFESSNTLSFSDGNKVTIAAGTSVASQLPKLRDQVGAEIIPNFTPDSSQYVTSSTAAKSIISVNPNQALDLTIASNPNSVTVLMADSVLAGRGTANITFSLPVGDLSEANIYSTTSSLEEILSGTIVPSARRALTTEEETAALVANNDPALVAKIWGENLRGSAPIEIVDPLRDLLPEDTFGKPEKKYLRFETESTDDDFLTTDDITLDEVTQPITIIELLEGQIVALVGKNATEVKQSLSTYFSTQDLTPTAAPSYFLTFVPTGSPTTLVPTFLPTVDPTTNQPTKNPTFVPSTTPSGEPTWAPSEDPSSEPTYTPSIDPSGNPTMVPTLSPTGEPTEIPTFSPSYSPSGVPSLNPSFVPTESPTPAPSGVPSKMPTLSPTLSPTGKPSLVPTLSPTGEPTELPSYIPTYDPTRIPTIQLTRAPTNLPSNFPTFTPTINPTTLEPTLVPSFGPTQSPSDLPTIEPSLSPTGAPTVIPSESPTALPTEAPSQMPTFAPTMIPSDPPTSPPTLVPSLLPTTDPTNKPTRFPTFVPTLIPSADPTQAPTVVMTEAPTDHPSDSPSWFPTFGPTGAPITWMPTTGPSVSPTDLPSIAPSSDPTKAPTITPSENPSSRPSSVPTRMPSFIPSARPSVGPSGKPTLIPTGGPTSQPSGLPTEMPIFTWDPTGQPSYKPVADPSSIPSGTPTFYPTFDPTVEPTSWPSRTPIAVPSERPSIAPSFKAIGGSNNQGLSAGALGGIAAALTVVIGGIGLWWRNRNQRQAEARIANAPMGGIENIRERDGDDDDEIVIPQVAVTRYGEAAREEEGNIENHPAPTRLEAIVTGVLLGEENRQEPDLARQELADRYAHFSGDEKSDSELLEAESVDTANKVSPFPDTLLSPKPVIKPSRNGMQAQGPSIYDLPPSLRTGKIGEDASEKKPIYGIQLKPLDKAIHSGGGRGSDGGKSRSNQKVIPVTNIREVTLDGRDDQK
jgi:murein DD-endopeptidase MepM/ murein hydrolase activator NlpD/GH24 family phage-related lysozyme (muramidase)